jgi:hypothetical protein
MEPRLELLLRERERVVVVVVGLDRQIDWYAGVCCCFVLEFLIEMKNENMCQKFEI